MKAGKTPRRSGCPISYGLDVFGDKWTLLIIRDLVFFGRRTYGEFLEAGEGIATNILAERLKRLEDGGILQSRAAEKNRTKKIYSLTKKGADLIPILVEMALWGGAHDAKTAAPAAYLRRMRMDREEVIGELRKRAMSPRVSGRSPLKEIMAGDRK